MPNATTKEIRRALKNLPRFEAYSAEELKWFVVNFYDRNRWVTTEKMHYALAEAAKNYLYHMKIDGIKKYWIE